MNQRPTLDRLVRRALLDGRAARFLASRDDAEVAALVRAYDAAVAQQDRELRRAVDEGLGMLPRVLRRQVSRLVGGSS